MFADFSCASACNPPNPSANTVKAEQRSLVPSTSVICSGLAGCRRFQCDRSAWKIWPSVLQKSRLPCARRYTSLCEGVSKYIRS